MLSEGDPAPDFTLESDSGETVTLSQLRGRPAVVYFYPRDDTPGCTRQACAFRDLERKFEQLGAVIVGISTDDAASHRKFREKYGLPFTLLSDPEHAVAEAYGVWGERKFAGRTYMGVQRSTFLVAPNGTIAHAMYGVKPDTNPGEVLEALAAAAGAK